jgi:hypothetical protein
MLRIMASQVFPLVVTPGHCSHAAHSGQPTAVAAERQPGSPGGGPIPLP